MKQVELYGRVRYAVKIQGMSRREAARLFGIDRRTVDKMLAFSTPPGYRRKKAPNRPKLDLFVGIIDQILEDDTKRLKKQRHTSKRIFERLRDEYGFAGGITIVKDYVFAARQRQREMYVPLSHSPGHAQADFGEADAVIAEVYPYAGSGNSIFAGASAALPAGRPCPHRRATGRGFPETCTRRHGRTSDWTAPR